MNSEINRDYSEVLRHLYEYLPNSQDLAQVDATDNEVLIRLPISCIDLTESSLDKQFRRVRRVERKLSKEFEKTVRIFIPTGDLQERIEESFAAAIYSQFPGAVERVYLSPLDQKPVVAWIIPTKPSSVFGDTQKKAITQLCYKCGEFHRVTIGEVKFTREIAGEPGPAEILRAIKISQPVGVNEIKAALIKRGRSVPEGRWLPRELDRLRQADLICMADRDKASNAVLYSLTYSGLLALPSQTDRNSSDVERALAIARRRW